MVDIDISQILSNVYLCRRLLTKILHANTLSRKRTKLVSRRIYFFKNDYLKTHSNINHRRSMCDALISPCNHHVLIRPVCVPQNQLRFRLSNMASEIIALCRWHCISNGWNGHGLWWFGSPIWQKKKRDIVTIYINQMNHGCLTSLDSIGAFCWNQLENSTHPPGPHSSKSPLPRNIDY